MIVPTASIKSWGQTFPQWTQANSWGANDASAVFQSPDAQEKVARAKLSEYAAKYGPEGATKAWFAGPTGMNNLNAKDMLGTTVSNYAQKAMANMGNMPKLAFAGPGLPTGAMGPSPAPASAPAATAGAPGGGPLAVAPPAQGAPAARGPQVAQNTQVAAGPGGISPAVPPSPAMGAPAMAPAGPGGTIAPGMFAQRPRISQQQYYAIMANRDTSEAAVQQKQNATAIWQSQNQPVSLQDAIRHRGQGAEWAGAVHW